MINYQEAQQLIAAQAHSFGKEQVPLEQAFGRVLAETIRADRDYPPFNRATMDGYAFRHADFEKGLRQFEVVATIFAGQAPSQKISSGQSYKIMTGAAVPAEVDCIIRREDTQENGGKVTLQVNECKPFQSIARKGEDVKKEAVIINEPVACTASVISILATIGKTTVMVERLPKVVILTTGNEVKPVTGGVSPLQIRNSNSWLLKALLTKNYIQPVWVEHIDDDKPMIQAAFKKAINTADIILTCGGVSAGDADYIPAVAEETGFKKLFHKVAIKPGKPVYCGVNATGTMLFGLPGNPFSCLVTFTLFVQHYLNKCYGIGEQRILSFQFNGQRNKKSNLDEFFPVQLQKATALLTPLAFNGSGDIQAALNADGIGIHPADKMLLEKESQVSYIQL